MKVAICGKGGVGKTTLAAALVRALADRGVPVLAVDADPSPNLAAALGVAPDRAAQLRPLPRTLLEHRQAPDGGTAAVLARPWQDVVREHGVPVSERVTLLLMGRVDHAGSG